ncbi:MAG: class I SAM-dependent methyltransferase [Chloroflexi bacterium]|nr:class I SAM-dependent methyltransferase [Chloroflexota bacterium]MBU1748548.1 class I SAM-dependent methyltransferase [Chloroflexota bacterium]
MSLLEIACLVTCAGLSLAGAAVAFIVLTEGRYLGKSLVRWLYDRLAGALAASEDTARWDAFLRAVPIASQERMLDVGTAAGHLPLAVAGKPGFQGHVVGLDWSLPLIQRAQQQVRDQGLAGHTAFLVADARDPLPFALAPFDTVFCLGVLDALPQPEERLADLARLTRPGGRLVLSLSRRIRLADRDYAWFRRHLATLGFRSVERHGWTRLYDLVTARR